MTRAATSGETGVPCGLPQSLPDVERVLWQGSPGWRPLMRHAFHLRTLALYFGILIAWCAANRALGGAGPAATLHSTALFTALALAPLLLIALYAWLTARTTVYTVTDRRLVLRIGIALPMSMNLPFAVVETAGLRLHRDGSGDIPLTVSGRTPVAYLLLWPHARPWRLKHAEPMLRAVPDAAHVAQIVARALSSAACVPARAIEPQTAARPHAADSAAVVA